MANSNATETIASDVEIAFRNSRRKIRAEIVGIPEFAVCVRSGPGAFRFKILDSEGRARSLRIHAVDARCASLAVTFVEELNGDGAFRTTYGEEQTTDPFAMLVWIYCEGAIVGDQLVFQKEGGVAPMLRVNAYRGDSAPQNIIPMAAVTDVEEHTVAIALPD